MRHLSFKWSDYSARELVQELHGELEDLFRERDKIEAAINGVSQHILNECEFEVGDKVEVLERTPPDIKPQLYIYKLYVSKQGSVYARLCEPLKSDGSMPEDINQKGIDQEYRVTNLRLVE